MNVDTTPRMTSPSPTEPDPGRFEQVLRRMLAGGEDPLVLFRDLMASVRPASRGGAATAVPAWRALVRMLEDNPDYRSATAGVVRALFAGRDQRPLYTEAGLLPNSGFFSELWRKLAHKMLPELLDERNLRDCMRIIFPGKRDATWLQVIPPEEWGAFWSTINGVPHANRTVQRAMREQFLDSAVILGHRIAAMGLEPELLRVLPRLGRGESPFIALCDEMTGISRRYSTPSAALDMSGEDERHLLVLLDQCHTTVASAHQIAARQGTSMTLTFLIVRLQQHLTRLELMVMLLATDNDARTRAQLAERWSIFLRGVIAEELQRNGIMRHLSGLLLLVSLRVTENAGRTGEHYLARNRAELKGIARAAAGAGLLIPTMALLKILGASLKLPLLNQGLINGAIYGGGFAIIHLCHGIVATKQPAMTAATIAATVSQTSGRLRDMERLAELVVAAVRGQIAAIAGNVLVAFPFAMALSLAAQYHTGSPLMSPEKAAALLNEMDPVSGPTLLYAAVAGFWLFMAGLVSGYVDNLTAYGRVGLRITALPWLQLVAGPERARRIGTYLDRNAGGLAGNLFFGLMLGLTPTIGIATGLPMDIRHIAFSAANLGHSLVASGFHPETAGMMRAAAGVMLIGAVNLGVSFSLALWVALRSRNVHFSSAGSLIPVLWRRLRSRPVRLIPPDRKEP